MGNIRPLIQNFLEAHQETRQKLENNRVEEYAFIQRNIKNHNSIYSTEGSTSKHHQIITRWQKSWYHLTLRNTYQCCVHLTPYYNPEVIPHINNKEQTHKKPKIIQTNKSLLLKRTEPSCNYQFYHKNWSKKKAETKNWLTNIINIIKTKSKFAETQVHIVPK
jgi:hypothetical protein